MKFGMLHLFEAPNGRSERRMLEEQLNLMESAEDLGFDSLWTAEHHFSEYGVCGFPALNLAAELKEVTGIDHLLCWTRLGGLSDELILAHMERMRDSVMPALR